MRKGKPGAYGRLHQPFFPRRAAVAEPGKGDSPFAHLRSSRGAAGLVGGLCPFGQEAYSFRILWALLAEKTGAVPSLEIWATDVNPDYLARAIEGIYPARALARVPAEARARFFRPAGKASFRVADELREGIRWKLHDLTADATPERDFHIIFLRNNLLTYYRDEIVKAALPAIVNSLVPGGYLVIGRKREAARFPGRLPPAPVGILPVPEAGIKRDGVMGRSRKLSSCTR